MAVPAIPVVPKAQVAAALAAQKQTQAGKECSLLAALSIAHNPFGHFSLSLVNGALVIGEEENLGFLDKTKIKNLEKIAQTVEAKVSSEIQKLQAGNKYDIEGLNLHNVKINLGHLRDKIRDKALECKEDSPIVALFSKLFKRDRKVLQAIDADLDLDVLLSPKKKETKNLENRINGRFAVALNKIDTFVKPDLFKIVSKQLGLSSNNLYSSWIYAINPFKGNYGELAKLNDRINQIEEQLGAGNIVPGAEEALALEKQELQDVLGANEQGPAALMKLAKGFLGDMMREFNYSNRIDDAKLLKHEFDRGNIAALEQMLYGTHRDANNARIPGYTGAINGNAVQYNQHLPEANPVIQRYLDNLIVIMKLVHYKNPNAVRGMARGNLNNGAVPPSVYRRYLGKVAKFTGIAASEILFQVASGNQGVTQAAAAAVPFLASIFTPTVITVARIGLYGYFIMK